MADSSGGGARAARAPAVLRCGAIAREVLAGAGEITVHAVHERSFYLMCPTGLVCVGEGIGAGPINVEIAAVGRGGWLAWGVTTDAEGELRDGIAHVSDELALDAAAADVWLPPAMPALAAATVAHGLACLRGLAAGRLPPDGLARLVLPAADAGTAPPSPEARMAAGPIATLRDVLPGSLAVGAPTAPLIRAATLLLGLGPGLTPSGDDFLGGLLLALTAGGRTALRDRLWQALAPELDALTVPVSAMHLSAAADGMAGEPVHLLLNALLGEAAEELPARHARVAGIGHTSGWDTLAGLVLGLEAILAADASR